MPDHQNPDQLIPLRTIRAEYVQISIMTAWRWIQAGQFPAPDVVLNNTRYWKRGTVASWQRERLESAAA